ncbi:hypothetical protein AB205_0011000 [Aquarana catesbeiana]|uniref:Uncharacterized protein n=1 Tax=Aquarana catesbeiana TaxID=8400 RepID=A0A2G9SAN3_AQUCT|nr:hypothetical protein AB205_0011000 [Aquarana catesbeiana]
MKPFICSQNIYKSPQLYTFLLVSLSFCIFMIGEHCDVCLHNVSAYELCPKCSPHQTDPTCESQNLMTCKMPCISMRAIPVVTTEVAATSEKEHISVFTSV